MKEKQGFWMLRKLINNEDFANIKLGNLGNYFHMWYIIQNYNYWFINL